MSEDATKHLHHGIDYIEFTVSDVAAAKTFYAAALGWTFNDYGPDYAGIVSDGKEMGGLTKGEPVPGGPLVVLYSRQLELTRSSIERAGGNIAKAIFEFPGGRRFHFTDPSGNELAVWSPAAATNGS